MINYLDQLNKSLAHFLLKASDLLPKDVCVTHINVIVFLNARLLNC